MQNAKTCDDAIKYAMKNSMERPTADNMAAFVQLGSELVDALEKADGNIKKMYASYTKECSGPWNKGLKKQGYTKLGGSAYEKCIEKNRSVDDYRRSIKEFIKQAKAMLQDEDVLPSLILAMAKVPALGPLFKVAMNMA